MARATARAGRDEGRAIAVPAAGGCARTRQTLTFVIFGLPRFENGKIAAVIGKFNVCCVAVLSTLATAAPARGNECLRDLVAWASPQTGFSTR
jgi:hypothetical protein